MKRKKVLILGGSGFIGLGIARYIGENSDFDISIADINIPNQNDLLFNNIIRDYSINIINDDFTDPKSFNKLDKDYDYVYMLASVVGVNRCIEEPHEVIRINTSLIQNTISWIIKNKIGKVLFSSSSECYSATTDDLDFPIPTSEEVPLAISDIGHPRFTYAVTKMLGESAFLNYGRIYKFPVTIVRYQNIFGPRMGFKHVIPHLVERFYNNESPFKIYGSKQTRAFCYISDAAKCTVMAMEKNKTNQEIFHIGSPEEITIENLVKEVGDLMKYNGKYLNASTYPGSVDRRCPDISKTRKLLNYEPLVHWKDGLKETVSWYKDFFKSGVSIQSGGFKAPEELTYH